MIADTMAPKRGDKPMTPKQILELRESLGLTQTEAGERVGVTQRTWSNWETGAIVPSVQSVMLLRLLAQKKI